MSRSALHRRLPVVACLVGAGLLVSAVAGCSKGSITDRSSSTTTTKPLSAAEQTEVYVKAVIPLIRELTGVDPNEQEATECLARRWIDTIGVQNLVDAKVAPDQLQEAVDDLELTQAQADEMAKAFAPCQLDLAALVSKRIGETVGADTDLQACIDAALTPERVEQSIASALMGNTAQTEAQTALEACSAGS